RPLPANLRPFTAWDGQWYVSIAQRGYHAAPVQPGPLGGHHDFAFYPAWPLLMKIASLDGRLPMARVGLVLANALFVGAAIVVFLVVAEVFGTEAARWGVGLLAFSPASYVLTMTYSEPLFLGLTGLYFLNRGRRSQPLIAAATMFARVTGLAILASAAVRFWR